MTPSSDKKTRDRILIALDASAKGFAVLEAAAELATQLHADLHGLFVEDANLLNMAGLPFVMECGYSAPDPRPLDAAAVRRRFQLRADRARRVLEDRASKASLTCTFDVRRGRLVRETLAFRETADLFILGHQRRSVVPVKRPATRASGTAAVLAFCPNAQAGRRTLSLAARISQADSRPILLIFPSSDDPADQKYRDECVLWLRQQGVSAQIGRETVSRIEDFSSAARRHPGHVMLLALDSSLIDEAAIDRLACEIDIPLALVP